MTFRENEHEGDAVAVPTLAAGEEPTALAEDAEDRPHPAEHVAAVPSKGEDPVRLYLEEIGTFAPVQVTYEAVRKRLLSAGTSALEHLFETVSCGLAQWSHSQHASALSLASFASQVVALDESTFDRLRRLTADLRDLPTGDPHLVPGKLAGLFDLRLQRWVRMQFRAEVLAGCNIGVLTLLTGLPPGSLILADLGYFSFPWFDYLTGQG